MVVMVADLLCHFSAISDAYPGQKKDDGVILYTTDAILSDQSIGLSHAGMVLIALLVGGDYDEASMIPIHSNIC